MDKIIECLSTIVFYNGHEEWLKEMAEDLKNSDFYCKDFQWGTEQHAIYEILVVLFGDWGTSVRSGWILKTKECSDFIYEILKENV